MVVMTDDKAVKHSSKWRIKATKNGWLISLDGSGFSVRLAAYSEEELKRILREICKSQQKKKRKRRPDPYGDGLLV